MTQHPRVERGSGHCGESLQDELQAVRDFAAELAIGKRRLERQANWT